MGHRWKPGPGTCPLLNKNNSKWATGGATLWPRKTGAGRGREETRDVNGKIEAVQSVLLESAQMES